MFKKDDDVITIIANFTYWKVLIEENANVFQHKILSQKMENN